MAAEKIIDVNDPDIVEIFVSVIKDCGIVVYPTDTCYGLAVDAFSYDSVKRVFDIKRRSFNLPLSIITARENINKYADLSLFPENKLPSNIPTPLTVILTAKAAFPELLIKDGKIGVRIENYPPFDRILRRTGLVVTATSANISGSKDPYTVSEVLKEFNRIKIDLIINGGALITENKVSAVVDLTNKYPVVIREGIAAQKLIDILK